jgi:hypothetical protein
MSLSNDGFASTTGVEIIGLTGAVIAAAWADSSTRLDWEKAVELDKKQRITAIDWRCFGDIFMAL